VLAWPAATLVLPWAAFLPPVVEHAARMSGRIMSNAMPMARLLDLNIFDTSG